MKTNSQEKAIEPKTLTIKPNPNYPSKHFGKKSGTGRGVVPKTKAK
jgi:hypothetical protein